ncbi:hypothetical protein I316_03196 [Kwoniella heveanensis BCC8398]|uniref:PLC-like phosphodiesterase n=1 Tax=Kwoniella heveanensis BCC8398 TaxID=1296120 RepID=A0A1B9GVT6_9TREE|nr:hypothetical protein I316_03196 [Kwoniella heveanensis BCC8398]
MRSSFASTLLSFFAVSLTVPALVSAADTCNGHSELCDRKYSNVTFIGAHNSYGNGDSIADNQNKDVTAQLDDGVRTLQLQAHNTDAGVHLCHSSCSLLDGGSLEDYLKKVVSWISSNPNDVVTIVLTNPENLAVSTFSPILTSAGIADYMYTPSASSLALSDWPTLGELIDQKKNVVAFLDYQADFSSEPRLIDEFSNMFEDAYDVTDASFSCAVNRTSGDASSQMMLINHFLDTSYAFGGTSFWVPNKDELNTTNAASGDGSIGFHVGNCVSIWGRNPNHILLDYYDTTSNAPFNVAATLNGVSAPTNTVTPGAVASSTGSGSASGTASASGQTAKISSSSLSSAMRRIKLENGLGGAVVAVSVLAGVGMGVGAVLL